MSSSSQNIWPTAPIVVPDQVKRTILRFFEISDSLDTSSGRLFADELFTKDAVFTTHPSCVFRGRQEIASSRERNNPLITSRSHELRQVFCANSPASNLLVSGRFMIGLKGGEYVEMDFNARFVIAAKEAAKLSFVQVWTDPTDMTAALKRAEKGI